MADFAAMVREASKKVGNETQETTSNNNEESQDSGIVIESQNAEHIRGQSKSGK